ncbi:MAG: hydantoinase/oxoprolinase family protein [Clostridia bacterium]|nr:hydantoinase/oxoprolinase family protein [Clostridia bacterium]
MKIGIDVGGTYTDAVLLDGSRLVEWAKTPTQPDNLLASLTGALDQILQVKGAGGITRVTISTTIITNLVVEEKYEPVALILIPGPGYNPKAWRLAPETRIIKGAVDFRGKIIQEIIQDEVLTVIKDLADKGFSKLAVVGKFSIRNPILEERVREIILGRYPDWEVELGHTTAGHLNFPRRAATTVLTAATKAKYARFVRQVEDAVRERKISAPIYVLKADGGTVPLGKSVHHPVDTIFSGPAASVLGALAMTGEQETGVVVDMGGTTTDLALILAGQPLVASQGAPIGHYKTQVRAFAVTSVALGGDSGLRVEDGQLKLDSRRYGPAACLGGPGPTPTDAFRVLALTDIGDLSLARGSMAELGAGLGLTPEEAAEEVAQLVTSRMVEVIEEMFRVWQEEPAYRLWEILHKAVERPRNIIGVGGAAVIVDRVAKAMGCTGFLPLHGRVANAVGAALAQPSVVVTLRADSQRGFYNIEEEGIQLPLPEGRDFKLADGVKLAEEWLKKRGQALGVEVALEEREVVRQEVFNLVRGHGTVGRIIDIIIQTPWKIEGLLEQQTMAAGRGGENHE